MNSYMMSWHCLHPLVGGVCCGTYHTWWGLTVHTLAACQLLCYITAEDVEFENCPIDGMPLICLHHCNACSFTTVVFPRTSLSVMVVLCICLFSVVLNSWLNESPPVGLSHGGKRISSSTKWWKHMVHVRLDVGSQLRMLVYCTRHWL